MAVFNNACTVHKEATNATSRKVGSSNVGIVGTVLYQSHIQRGNSSHIVVASNVVVFTDNKILHHTILVDAAKEAVIFSFGVIIRLGVINAADGMPCAIKNAVKAIGNGCYLCVAILTNGGQLLRCFGRATKVDVVLQNKILASALVVSITAFGHGVQVIGSKNAIGVSLCAFARKTPGVRCGCALG